MSFVFMVENKNDLGEGLRLFVEISGSIAGPIVFALILGQALDKHFGTKPWIFLILAGVGFIVTSLGILKIVKRYTKK